MMSHRKLEVKTLKWYPTASRQKVSEGKQGTCDRFQQKGIRAELETLLSSTLSAGHRSETVRTASQRDIAKRPFLFRPQGYR